MNIYINTFAARVSGKKMKKHRKKKKKKRYAIFMRRNLPKGSPVALYVRGNSILFDGERVEEGEPSFETYVCIYIVCFLYIYIYIHSLFFLFTSLLIILPVQFYFASLVAFFLKSEKGSAIKPTANYNVSIMHAYRKRRLLANKPCCIS